MTLWTEFYKISFENYFRLRISTVKFSHDFLSHLFLDLIKQIIVLEYLLYPIPPVYPLYSGGQKKKFKIYRYVQQPQYINGDFIVPSFFLSC